jgi:hypothetical protein
MGLWRGKAQNIFMGFYIFPNADDKEGSTYQEKRYVQKKKKREETRKDGKVSIKKHSVPRLRLRGLRQKKRRENHKVRIISKNIARDSIWNRYIYIF